MNHVAFEKLRALFGILLFVMVFGMTAAQGAESQGTIIKENIFVELARKSVPWVVNISTLSTVKSPFLQGAPDDLFRRFFEEFFGQEFGGSSGENAVPPSRRGGHQALPKAVSLGSGFIIDASGIILTNNHVVAGADEIKVQFTEAPEETPTDGTVIGRDPDLDVALIRVKTKRKMEPAMLGESNSLQVGEYVIAVGNPFGQGHSVTHGIISATGRMAPQFPLGTYLQTDAPINPGNSGGPLVNIKGEVIGINNAIEARAQGIGFAIPISLVKAILPQLQTKGVVSRGYIGILVDQLTPEIATSLNASKDLHAPIVTQVYPGDPAEKAGLKPYDIILQFNNKETHSPIDLINAVTSTKVGASVPIKILRNGKEMTLTIKIEKRPEPRGTSPKQREGGKKKKETPHVNTGLSLEDLTPDIAQQLGMPSDAHGVVVDDVQPDTPADRAGLTRGDVILEVDRKTVASVQEFYSIVKAKKDYLLRVRRLSSQGTAGFAVIVLALK